MSDFFHYKDGELHAENCKIADLAQRFGTPFYLYSANAIRQNYQAFDTALKEAGLDYGIFYAVKANSNQAVISLLKSCGSGADVVSKGEIMRALAAGIGAKNIVFSGVGKSADEMDYALDVGILQFNVESESELQLLNQVAEGKGVVADVALRVNPDVDAKTHAKISTGLRENKFGIPMADAMRLYKSADEMEHINPVAVAMHIGSQLLDLQPYKLAWEKMRTLVEQLKAEGISLERLDLGGGLGVAYDGEKSVSLQDYARLVADIFDGYKVRFMFEPGRSLVANGGVLVTRILHIKHGEERRFVIVDAAMNDFIRPTLYDGFHRIEPVQAKQGAMQVSDIVGPVCESGDFFAKGRELSSDLQNGELLCICDVGAYGAVMSGNYNSRPRIAEVMVQGSEAEAVHIGSNEDALISADSVPKFIG